MRIQKNSLSGLCFLSAITLSINPFRVLIINDMMWHMNIQMPLLILSGVFITFPEKFNFDKLIRLNLYGLTSFILSQLILAYWMLPISIDRAIINWKYDIAKIISLVLCGILIRLSLSKSTLVMEIFFIGYFLSMMIWAGNFYFQSNERLCNVYSQDSQQFAGAGLMLIGAMLTLIWISSKLKSQKWS